MSTAHGSQSLAAPARRICSALLIGVVLGSLSSTRPASAEESASDRATARALAGEGYSALKEKDYETAEDRFRRADELVHAPTLVVDHARALVGLGRIGEAYEAYESVVKETVPADAPPVWKAAAKNAQREMSALKPKLAWLTINVKGPLEPHVEMDGRVLPADALGQQRPATPGERSFEVSADGFISKTAQLTLIEGSEQTLELELLPVPKPAPIIVAAPPVVVSPLERETNLKEKRNRTLAYVAFGVSGVSLATGAAAGILWLKARRDVKADCGALTCDAQSDSEDSRFTADKRRYDTFGTISGIGFVAGIAGAATGAALLLIEPKPDAESAPKSASIKPYWAPTSVGIRGTF
jgi:hypothetical protein